MWPVLLKSKAYNKTKLLGCTIDILRYDKEKWVCNFEEKQVDIQSMINAIAKHMLFPINFTLKSDGVILQHKYSNGQDIIVKLATNMKKYMEICYGTGTNLAGHCIEASCYLEKLLMLYGITDIKQVEGWCLFEDEDYGSDRPYDEHTWLELGNEKYYLDITADQFNPALFGENKFKPIELRVGCPKWMMHTEPEEGYDYWIDC